MRRALQALSFAGLGLTVLPSLMVFLELISWNLHASLMMVGTVLWFVSAPFWMNR